MVLHLVGVIGLNTESYQPVFARLTWLNLLLSFALVIAHHRGAYGKLWLLLGYGFATGMAAEIVGVHTGLPFGRYHYTDMLGADLWEVPWVIGMNWALLAYVSSRLAMRITRHGLPAALTGASLMTAVDFLLEPFAIRHGFWVWHEGQPPLQNYIGWWALSLLIQLPMVRLRQGHDNHMAYLYALVLCLFLLADWLCAVTA